MHSLDLKIVTLGLFKSKLAIDLALTKDFPIKIYSTFLVMVPRGKITKIAGNAGNWSFAVAAKSNDIL